MARHGVRRDDSVIFFFLLLQFFGTLKYLWLFKRRSVVIWMSSGVCMVFACSKFGVTAAAFSQTCGMAILQLSFRLAGLDTLCT